MEFIEERVPTYMSWSICTLLFCFFPLGVLALILSCKAKKLLDSGNVDLANDAVKMAKKLNNAGIAMGILLILLTIIWAVIRGVRLAAHS